VTVVTDGGGRVRAALRPVVGRAAVARLLLAISPSEPAVPRTRMVEVNGAPALVTTDRGRLTHVGLVQARGGRAWRIFVVANPDKLQSLARQLTARNGAATVPLTAADAGPARSGIGGD
jgi:RNA polymerase sigma-70 factor (ECF subfamily)